MPHPKVRAVLTGLVLMIGVPIIVLALLEGLASMLLFGRDFEHWTSRPPPLAQHLAYDPELGWAHIPNASLPDMYGPGVGLHTNSRGFRGVAEVADTPQAGWRRVVCSGDSFTLGYGVADADTWCARLAGASGNLEAVNMGQGGYGVDQAFLWYRRDGMKLVQDAQVFAYITDDFRRMRTDRFQRIHGKPRLVLHGDSLLVRNVPVPRAGIMARLGNRTLSAARGLRLFDLADVVSRRFSPRTDDQRLAQDSASWDVVAAVVRTLAAYHRQHGSTLIVVHLPIAADYRSAQDTSWEPSAFWRSRMRTLCAAEQITFVDLVTRLQTVPRDSIAGMFNTRDWHFSAAGHRWAARELEPLVLGAIAASARRETVTAPGAPLHPGP